jgi:hypothetical protein
MVVAAQAACATKPLAQLLPRLRIPSLLARAGQVAVALEITEIILSLTPSHLMAVVAVVRFRQAYPAVLEAAADTAEVPGVPQHREIAAGLLVLVMPVVQALTMEQVTQAVAVAEQALRVQMAALLLPVTAATVGSTT